MSLSIIPPEGYISARAFSERYLVPETLVRSWMTNALVKVATRCGRSFVKDEKPRIKMPFDHYSPGDDYLSMGVWAAREKVSYAAVKNKVRDGELECMQVYTAKGAVRVYMHKKTKWRWKKEPHRYAKREEAQLTG